MKKSPLCCVRPVIVKELRQIRRDARSLIFLIAMPAVLLILYGYALNFDVKNIPIGILDEDGSWASRDLISKFTNTEYFDLGAVLSGSGEIDGLLGRDRIRAVIVIPSDFSDRLAAEREAAVQVIVDGADASSASAVIGYLGSIIERYSLKVTMQSLERRGLSGLTTPLDTEVRVWYNPELRSTKFLVPGLMAFILMVIVVVSTSFSVVREKERGTMEQIMVSPVRPAELILGKTIPYVLISLLSAHLVLLLGSVLFGVVIKGNYLLLLLTMVLFLTGALGQGILISTVTESQQVAFMISSLSTLLPTFVLSGFIFPVRNMPPFIQAVTYLVPAKYFLVALRHIILKGVGLRAFWEQMVLLCLFSGLTLGVSILRLKKREGNGRPSKRRLRG